MKKLAFLLVCIFLGLVAFTTPSATHSQAPVENKLGVHLLLDDGRNVWPVEQWHEHLTYARQMVGDWGYVVQLVRYDDLDPTRWQLFMDLCADLHLIPLLRLATTFDRAAGWWVAPRADADGRYHTVASEYARFVTALKWPTAAHYIIIGNEPNHGNEWGGIPDPAAYARFLMDVADALHRADSASVVLNGGFDHFAPHTGTVAFADGSRLMDAESFMDGMVAAEPTVFTTLEAWAAHAYPLGAFRQPPWEQQFLIHLLNDAANPNHLDPPADVYNRGINSYAWELVKLASYGIAPLPVFITETGWRHAESTIAGARDAGDWPDAATVAGYVDLALAGNGERYPDWPATGWTPWLMDERVVAVVFFALDGHPAEWGHTNWLQIQQDGTITGTYPPFELLANNFP